MLKISQFIFLMICIIFLFSKTTYANNFFVDDFKYKNINKWSYSSDGTISFDNDYINLSSDQYYFPYILANVPDIIPNDKDFSIEIKFRYPDISTMGNGIGIGFTGPSGNNFYQFQIWAGSNDGFYFVYNDFNNDKQGNCKDFSRTRNLTGRIITYLSFTYDWHVLKIEKTSDSYSIFMDDNNIYNTGNKQCIPQNIWFGNSVSGGSNTWTSLSLDYIKIYDGNIFKHKIILIPGLGASWNTRAIVYGENVADTDWKMIPFSKNYDSFISLLDKNDLIKGEDYYVWNYDWRQPVGTIVDKLNTFINTNVGSSETVDLVGHSLGGLVSRIWYQDHKNDVRINKVITLGSPHTGSVDAYDAWNGMKFSDGPDLTNIAVNLLLQLKRKGLENNLSLVRGNMPIFKDLIPIYGFIKKNKSVVSLDKLETKNIYLVNKNNSAVSLGKFKTYTGTGKLTKEFVNISDRNIFDKLLGIWPDGRPISYTSTDGDGTVIKKSARFETGTTDFYTLKSNHSSIIDNSLDTLKIDLNLTEAFTSITDENLAGNMVIFIGSPVDASLRCGDSSPVVAQDGFILVKKELNKNCILNLDGTGNGKYHLVLGDVDNSDNWYYHEDTVEVGQNIKFNLNLSINAPDYASQNPSFLYQQIKNDVELLTTNYGSNKYLSDALVAVDLKDNNKILDNIFGFRKLKKESEISGRILNNLEMLLVIDNKSVSQNVAMNTYKKALQNKSTVDRMTGIYSKRGIIPSSFSSLSYQSLENQITKLKKNKKNKNYPLIMAESKLVSKYATEIW